MSIGVGVGAGRRSRGPGQVAAGAPGPHSLAPRLCPAGPGWGGSGVRDPSPHRILSAAAAVFYGRSLGEGAAVPRAVYFSRGSALDFKKEIGPEMSAQVIFFGGGGWGWSGGGGVDLLW